MLLVQSINSAGTSDLGHLGPGNGTRRAPHLSMGTITPKQAIHGGSQAKIVISKP